MRALARHDFYYDISKGRNIFWLEPIWKLDYNKKIFSSAEPPAKKGKRRGEREWGVILFQFEKLKKKK